MLTIFTVINCNRTFIYFEREREREKESLCKDHTPLDVSLVEILDRPLNPNNNHFWTSNDCIRSLLGKRSDLIKRNNDNNNNYYNNRKYYSCFQVWNRMAVSIDCNRLDSFKNRRFAFFDSFFAFEFLIY